MPTPLNDVSGALTLPVELPADVLMPEAILRLAQQVLGMSVAFYAHMDAQQMQVHDAWRDPTHPSAPTVKAGIVAPFADTYCQFVYRSGQPLVVSNALATQPFATLPTTAALGIGSYVGVPLIAKDGSIWGTLCGVHETPYTVQAPQVMLLRLLGHALMAGIERAALLEELERQRATALLALRDALTYLPNRRALDAALKVALAQAAAQQQSLALLFVDIDHFKAVNDTYGHVIGDAALRLVAARLVRTLGDAGQAFRFGGEELVVLLPNATPAMAMMLAEMLRAAVGAPIALDELDLDEQPITLPDHLRLTASFGVATYPADAASADEMVQCADAAMYHAKYLGRDRCCAVQPVVPYAPLSNALHDVPRCAA